MQTKSEMEEPIEIHIPDPNNTDQEFYDSLVKSFVII